MTRIFLLLLIASSCGCQVALQQPGQTPAQVRACTTDATAVNVLDATGAVLATGAGVEGTVASLETGKTAQGISISVPITAGIGAALLTIAGYFQSAYNADGCSPSPSTSPKGSP